MKYFYLSKYFIDYFLSVRVFICRFFKERKLIRRVNYLNGIVPLRYQIDVVMSQHQIRRTVTHQIYGCTTTGSNVLIAVSLRLKWLPDPVATSPWEKLTNTLKSVLGCRETYSV